MTVTLTKAEKADRLEHARKMLAEHCPEGATVYTILRHRSASGMQRKISLVVVQSGQIVDITWAAAHVLKSRLCDKTGGIVVGGCGMDMGFRLVNNLSYALHGMKHPKAGQTLGHRWL